MSDMDNLGVWGILALFLAACGIVGPADFAESEESNEAN